MRLTTLVQQQQKSLFKVGSRSRRAGGAGSAANGGADFPMGLPQEGGEASFLFTPNIVRPLSCTSLSRSNRMSELTRRTSSLPPPRPSLVDSPSALALIPQPFDLDYFQVLVTTCELLIETYSKIATYLGPSGSGAGSSAGTSAFPSPPGAGAGAQQHRGSVTSPVTAGGGVGSGAGAGAAGSAGLSQALADVVYKVDARLKVRSPLPLSLSFISPSPLRHPSTRTREWRQVQALTLLLAPRFLFASFSPSALLLVALALSQKLVALLSKEIDTLARQTIKHELDSLGGGGLLDLLE